MRLRTVGAVVAAAAAALLAGPASAQNGPPTAELTIRETVGTERESRVLVIAAAGHQPSVDTFLADKSGQNPVNVRPLEPDDPLCEDVEDDEVRITGLGVARWCVLLEDVGAGHEVLGKLKGSESIVALTVTARHGWGLPAIVAFVSFLLAIVLVLVSTRWLPGVATSALLWLALRSDGGITDLPKWAKQASKGRVSESGVLARVRWARRHGKQHVMAARAELDAKLAAQPRKIPDCPLRTDGEAEAARTDVKASELLTPAGTRATSPAERLLSLVERAEGAIEAFDEIAAALLERIPADQKNAAKVLIQQTGQRPVAYLSEFTLDSIVEEFKEVLEQLRQWAADAPPRMANAALDAVPVGVRSVPAQLRAAAGGAARATFAIGAVTLTAGVLMLVATVAVLATAYVPNHTFGTTTDYVVLAATMLGSSAAAGTLTVLLLLRGPGRLVRVGRA